MRPAKPLNETELKPLLNEIAACTVCAAFLQHGPRPVLQAGRQSKLVIIGQAPGKVVHQSGIPWQDKSGDNLRTWLGIGEDTFYNPEQIALIPMGFCYPGKGKSRDLPPREECAPRWHGRLLQTMTDIKLTLLIGTYAQTHYLRGKNERTLTETVKNFKSYLPDFFVLPHPSPRNNIWMAKNPWFREEVVPTLQAHIKQIGL